MKLWLIRHGRTALTEEKRYQGRIDTGLSETGRAELRRSDRRPKTVYVSPAKRARETAAILFPEAEQIPVPALWEMDFGVFDGRGWWEMQDDPAYRSWVNGGCVACCPGGEDRETFSGRVCTAFESILDDTAKKGVEELFTVAHGGIQMAVLERWGNPPREYYRWQSRCGCGWLLDWDPDGRRLLVRKELSFLKENGGGQR